MKTIVDKIDADGTRTACYCWFLNDEDHEYNMLTLYMEETNRASSIWDANVRDKFKSVIQKGKHGTIYFELDGVVYITSSGVPHEFEIKRLLQAARDTKRFKNWALFYDIGHSEAIVIEIVSLQDEPRLDAKHIFVTKSDRKMTMKDIKEAVYNAIQERKDYYSWH